MDLDIDAVERLLEGAAKAGAEKEKVRLSTPFHFPQHLLDFSGRPATCTHRLGGERPRGKEGGR